MTVMTMTPPHKAWGEARATAEALRIAMDIAREREYHLSIKWISGEVRLNTYQAARAEFELACAKYLEACDTEAAQYDVVTNYQQGDPADLDAAADDDAARLSQGGSK